jgi:hypothetical protein
VSAGTSRLPNFVIGGTEKSGTTSVFDWLSRHPQVGASMRKETDFFRNGWTGDAAEDARRYTACFEHCDPALPVWMEASPGYLGEAALVAPRLASLVPGARVLFILRDPVARFQSSYEFHRGRLNLPESLGVTEYVRACLAYEDGRTPEALGLGEWYLKVLRFGCYAPLLATWRRHLPARQVKVTFFEALRRDEQAFMQDLSEFLGIDATFWRSFEFRPSNVTFSGRNKALHRLAVRTNSLAEPVLRRWPGLKQSLVRAYKVVNQERQGYDPMPAEARRLLEAYYAPSVASLAAMLDTTLPAEWNAAAPGRVAA